MLPYVTESKSKQSVPILLHTKASLSALEKQKHPDAVVRWAKNAGFTAAPGKFCLIPGKEGALESVLAGVPEELNLWSLAALPSALPEGTYRIDAKLNAGDATSLALGWALGTYEFTRYRNNKKRFATLEMPKNADAAYVREMAQTIFWVKDLINTPTNDMGPEQLADAALSLAGQYKAKHRVLVGDALLKENYPLIHAVGRAGAQAPRLVDIRWGKKSYPKVTLVGKGVCFDSGGLNIKSAGNMKLMKKDMAGVAILLGLARLVMKFQLPVQLRLLLPMVENSVDANAMRPLDVIRSRKGLTVEIGNTDAEGRLILADALAEAESEQPNLLIDVTTLTGAARIAVGTEIGAFFTPDDALAAAVARQSARLHDPLYRLPLWEDYRDMLKSNVADINNDPDSSYAGAITAALFLKEFVGETRSWLHLDMMAWNLGSKPGRPIGAEPTGLRALFELLRERYG